MRRLTSGLFRRWTKSILQMRRNLTFIVKWTDSGVQTLAVILNDVFRGSNNRHNCHPLRDLGRSLASNPQIQCLLWPSPRCLLMCRPRAHPVCCPRDAPTCPWVSSSLRQIPPTNSIYDQQKNSPIVALVVYRQTSPYHDGLESLRPSSLTWPSSVTS